MKLGTAYQWDGNVKRDYPKAVYYYKKACKQEVSEACHNLGWFYSEGHAVEKDIQKALSLWKPICDNDDMKFSAISCLAVAKMFEFEQGALETAGVYYTRACERGLGEACRLLGYRLEKGKWSSPSPKRAEEAFRSGCTSDDGRSCYVLAQRLRDRGVAQKDVDAAFRQADEVLQKNCGGRKISANLSACNTLAWMHCHDLGQCTERELAWSLRSLEAREEPDHVDTKAYILCEMGRINEGKKARERACELKPELCGRPCELEAK